MLTVTDLFCGAGGSSLGAESVPGVKLQLAANHWTKAIEVHQENFPEAMHDCADVSQVDFRRYPASDILIASPECTNHSQAKGVSRSKQAISLFDVPDPAAVRSRATMWDVHRFIEVHRPSAVVVENVLEARNWLYWNSWWQAFSDAGYTAKVLSINSMHVPAGVNGLMVPQSRDRFYVVATRSGIKVDTELRPSVWCTTCERDVEARQVFKRDTRQFGRYRQSWLWRCVHCLTPVEPVVAPASQAIDWSLPSQRIGDREKPLAPATLRRIQLGLERLGVSLVQGNSDTLDWVVKRYARAPVTRRGNTYDGMIVETAHQGERIPRSTKEPFRTMTASDDRPLLVEPPNAFYVRNFAGGEIVDNSMVHPVSQAFGAMTANDHTSLLVPYYNSGRARFSTEPIGTLTTKDRYALVNPAIDLDDCLYRMLEPHEVGQAMAFPDTYRVDGNKKDRVRLYGNAVTPPVMEFLVGRVAEALRVNA
jgi:DNA (cytosine-5)-methyltransferase 1